MKETDCVEVIVEKEKYAKEGVHKGMIGWICLERRNSFTTWLVNFPQYGAKPDIATISIDEEDLKLVPMLDVRVNERIKKEFGD